MSIKTPRTTATLIATLVVLAGAPWAARTQPVSASNAEPAIQSSLGDSRAVSRPVVDAAVPESRTPDDTESASAPGMAYPPSPLQTAGALVGALFAILLAIAGVTVTFRSMRNEMRRGRGRSRRPPSPDQTTLPQT